jgi:hypothetical protein
MARWYFVIKFDAKDGSEPELEKWIQTTGKTRWDGADGVKSWRATVRVMGLGERPIFQIWLEFENFAFLDRWKDEA